MWRSWKAWHLVGSAEGEAMDALAGRGRQQPVRGC